jgi:hypothetical protein
MLLIGLFIRTAGIYRRYDCCYNHWYNLERREKKKIFIILTAVGLKELIPRLTTDLEYGRDRTTESVFVGSSRHKDLDHQIGT